MPVQNGINELLKSTKIVFLMHTAFLVETRSRCKCGTIEELFFLYIEMNRGIKILITLNSDT